MSSEIILIFVIPTILYGLYIFSIFDNVTCFSKAIASNPSKSVFMGQASACVLILFFVIGFGIAKFTQKHYITTFIIISIIYIIAILILKSLGLTKKRYKVDTDKMGLMNLTREKRNEVMRDSLRKASESLKESEVSRKDDSI